MKKLLEKLTFLLLTLLVVFGAVLPNLSIAKAADVTLQARGAILKFDFPSRRQAVCPGAGLGDEKRQEHHDRREQIHDQRREGGTDRLEGCEIGAAVADEQIDAIFRRRQLSDADDSHRGGVRIVFDGAAEPLQGGDHHPCVVAIKRAGKRRIAIGQGRADQDAVGDAFRAWGANFSAVFSANRAGWVNFDKIAHVAHCSVHPMRRQHRQQRQGRSVF